MEHFGFILTSYLVAIFILGGVWGWLLVDYYRQKKILNSLQDQVNQRDLLKV